MDHTHHMHTNHEHTRMSHDHSHMGHGDDVHMVTCNMNMIFTWNTSDLCIIFHWWRIHGPISLVFSLLGVIAVTALFEAVRAACRRYELWVKAKKESQPSQSSSTSVESGKSPRASTKSSSLPSGLCFDIIREKEYHKLLNIAITESAPARSGQRLFNFHRRTHTIKAFLYAVQSFYGLMLMLIFMTYNGWVMMCMFIGSFLGYIIFGQYTKATKDGACH